MATKIDQTWIGLQIAIVDAMRLYIAILFIGLLTWIPTFAQVKQDMKEAGQSVGNAAKKSGKKAGHGTKHAARKAKGGHKKSSMKATG